MDSRLQTTDSVLYSTYKHYEVHHAFQVDFPTESNQMKNLFICKCVFSTLVLSLQLSEPQPSWAMEGSLCMALQVIPYTRRPG